MILFFKNTKKKMGCNRTIEFGQNCCFIYKSLRWFIFQQKCHCTLPLHFSRGIKLFINQLTHKKNYKIKGLGSHFRRLSMLFISNSWDFRFAQSLLLGAKAPLWHSGHPVVRTRRCQKTPQKSHVSWAPL